MNFDSYEKNGVSVLVPGISKGTSSQATALQQALNALLDEQRSTYPDRPPKLLVNLGNLSFIDSNFMGALVRVLKMVLKYNGELALCGMQAPVKSMFELTRLYNIFEIYSTEPQALESLAK